MMDNKKRLGRIARHDRLRKKIVGTPERPRLSVFRSHANIYAQVIDDVSACTIFSVSTQDKDIKKACGYGGNVKAAALLGEFIAKRVKEKGITKVVFDRGGYLYHGRVRALAEEARKAGLEF